MPRGVVRPSPMREAATGARRARADAKAPSYLGDGFALVKDPITFSEFCDELVWCVFLALHVIASRIDYGRTSHIGYGSHRVHHSMPSQSF